MLQGMTAHYLTHSTFPLQPGQTCLVHAAAGGAGAADSANGQDCRSNRNWDRLHPRESDLAREHGADHMILYTEKDFLEEVKRITGGGGVHVVYDSVGSTTFIRVSTACGREA